MAEFDRHVHTRDPKSGHIVKTNAYRMVHENGITHFIRDGVRYYEDGSLVDPPVVAPEPPPVCEPEGSKGKKRA